MRSESPSGRRPGRPAFDPEIGARVIERYWGRSGKLRELPSDSDQNFRVTPEEGPEFVLRIANSQQDEVFLKALVDLLAGLERYGLGTQRAVPTLSGQRLIQETGPDNTAHWVWLTEWVEGRTLADHPVRGPETLASLGSAVARLDEGLDGYAASADTDAFHRSLDWDLARAASVLAGSFEAHSPTDLFGEERWELFRRAYDDHTARTGPLLGLLPMALVHNDTNDHNVLISDDSESPAIVGILDFGDAVVSYRIADLAIACTYAVMGSATPVDDIETIVKAYASSRPLSMLEARMVLPLVRLRLLVSVTMSAKAALIEPDNPYLVISQAPAWQLLRQLDPVDMERTADRIARSAGHGIGRPEGHGEAAYDTASVLAARQRLLGPSLSLSYDEPLHIERGWMQYLVDTRGRAYLDCVNNVCHVGHSHPDVVSALARQAEKLNTNSRYLHPLRVRYATALLERLPDHLDTCFFVSSGSEANELALRIARVATGRTDVVVQDAAYHGSTSAMVDLSPYKFSGPGGGGRPQHVHISPLPDPFREVRDHPDAAAHFVRGVEDALERAEAGGGAAAFFAEPIPSCGGQVVPPAGYLKAAFERARDFGGLAVADEVQTGFGRIGSAFWAFELDGAVPDIVTMGKPIGNGHPIGAVAVRRELAERFANGMEYFSTFGGNPVSCAVGLAVLEVIEREGLQGHALEVGQSLLARLDELRRSDDRLGDVRGQGLFLGIEFVVPGEAREPDAALAHAIVQSARDSGVLLSTDGPHHNVIKIKPPLPFDRKDADRVVDVVAAALRG